MATQTAVTTECENCGRDTFSEAYDAPGIKTIQVCTGDCEMWEGDCECEPVAGFTPAVECPSCLGRDECHCDQL